MTSRKASKSKRPNKARASKSSSSSAVVVKVYEAMPLYLVNASGVFEVTQRGSRKISQEIDLEEMKRRYPMAAYNSEPLLRWNGKAYVPTDETPCSAASEPAR